nr:hypothetical protein CFP56_65585 [Quercus suber]
MTAENYEGGEKTLHWLSSRRLTIDNANAIRLDDGELLKLDGASEDSSIDPRTVESGGGGGGGGVGKFKSCADPISAGDRGDFEGPKPANIS